MAVPIYAGSPPDAATIVETDTQSGAAEYSSSAKSALKGNGGQAIQEANVVAMSTPTGIATPTDGTATETPSVLPPTASTPNNRIPEAGILVSTASAGDSGNGEQTTHEVALVQTVATAFNLANMVSGLENKASSFTPETTYLPIPGALDDQVTSASPPATASVADAVRIPASYTYMFAPVTPTGAQSSKPSSVKFPSAQNGNKAMASGFNQIYQTMSMTSQCDANNKNQEFACISGELAQCQSDGLYVLKSCPDGQSCYALPRPSGESGVSVECAVPSDAAAVLGAGSSPVSPIASSSAAATQTPKLASSNDFAVSPEAPSDMQLPPSHTAENDKILGGSGKISETVSAQMPQSTAVVQNIGETFAHDGKTGDVSNGIENGEQAESSVQALSAESVPLTTAESRPTAAADRVQLAQSAPNSEATSSSHGADNDSGPLFTVVEPTSPAKHEHQAQPTQSDDSPAETSTPAPGPSVLVEQKSTPAEQAQAVPPPQSFEAGPQKAQETHHVEKPSPANSAENAAVTDSGITITPLGGNTAANNHHEQAEVDNNGPVVDVHEKVAVPSHSVNGAIYITVTETITTTVYTQGPVPSSLI